MKSFRALNQIILLSLIVFGSSPAFAANYMCASNPADPVFNLVVTTSGSSATINGERVTVVRVRKTVLNNGTQAFALRVGNGDWFWGILCLPN